MEPLHPILPLQESLKAIVIILIVLTSVQFLLGHWDKFIAVAYEYIPPTWFWGG